MRTKTLMFFALFLVIFISCENEFIEESSKAVTIDVAKTIYESEIGKINSQTVPTGKAGKNRKSIKKNLLWDQAKFRQLKFEDGEETEGVVVPVNFEQPLSFLIGIDLYSASDLTSVLIYRKGNVNNVEIVTLFPDPSKQTNKFSGSVSVENLSNEYIKGYVFENGIAVGTSKFSEGQQSEKDNGRTNTFSHDCGLIDWYTCAYNDGEISDCHYTDTTVECGGAGGGMPSGDGGGNYSPDSGGTSSGSSSSSGSNTTSNPIVVVGPDRPISNMAAYLQCLDKTKSAVLTIYAEQPEPGEDDAYTLVPFNVGHTFISIQQNGTIKVFGFYPEGNSSPKSGSGPSTMGNNSGALFSVSISKNISASQLAAIINASINFPDFYDLNKNNCTDFAISIGRMAGMTLPDCYNDWIGGGGSNPGTLGEYIRDNPQIGTTVNLVGGNAPQNVSGCISSL